MALLALSVVLVCWLLGVVVRSLHCFVRRLLRTAHCVLAAARVRAVSACFTFIQPLLRCGHKLATVSHAEN